MSPEGPERMRQAAGQALSLFRQRLQQQFPAVPETAVSACWAAARSHSNIRVCLCQVVKNCCYTYLKKDGQTGIIEDIDFLNISAHDDTVGEHLSRQDKAIQIQKIPYDTPAHIKWLS